MAQINTYHYGQKIRVATYKIDPITGDPVEGTGLKDVTGTLVDPASITVTITKPSGEQIEKVDGELEHPGTGQYYYDVLIDENTKGNWFYFWQSTGDVEAADESHFKALTVHKVTS